MSALTASQIEERRKFIGASDMPAIMRGDWFDLWCIKTGRSPPADLSDVFAVQLGIATEALNLDFYERRVGHRVIRRGEAVVSAQYPFLRCTLDGFDRDLPGPVQAKHVNAFSKMPDVRARYYPQVTTEMICTGTVKGILSVIIGTEEPARELIEFDDFYALEMMERAAAFWDYVVRDVEPPGAPPAAPPPIPVEKMRVVSMAESNAWGEHAARWLANKKPAATFKDAEKELKALVEADVREAFGHGIIARRDKRGISIKEA